MWVISAGYRIGLFDVESALAEHPALLEAAIVASPDPVRGKMIKACMSPAPSYQPSEQLAAEMQGQVKTVIAPSIAP